MTYQSLYRRYRSQNFAEILGQPHITDALRDAVAGQRYGHAYLFSGPRGTGKTSTARVLAKALNCENLTDGEPCGTCASCVGIESGKSFDLHELDAASNNKVDDIRDLISKVQLGSPGRTKVYILDEVHMLSSGAENALLKTLEEPPDHVVFVLATTEPHKVVPTIRSRTQHYEFHLLPADVLADHVREVIADAGLDVDEEAIDFVLRQGGGSARDTLSALDLVAAAGGVPRGTDVAENVVRAIGEHDPATAIAAVQEGLELGREPRTIGEDALDLLRNAFLAAMDAPLGHLNDRAETTARDLATALGPATLTRSLEAIGETLVEMRQAPDPRVRLEVTLLRLTRPTAGGDTSALEARIEALESRVAELEAGGGGAAAQASDRPSATASPDEAPATPEADPVEAADTAAADEVPPESTGVGGGERAPRAPRPPRRGGGGEARPSPRSRQRNQAAQSVDAETDVPSASETKAQGPTGAPEESPEPEAPPPEALSAEGDLSLNATTEALNTVLDDLNQKVRARFKGGRILAVSGTTVTFGTPNMIHRDRCEDVKGDVEAALATNFGHPVVVEVVIDDASSPPIDPAKLETPEPKAAPVDPVVEEAEIGPVAELADADDGSSTGVDRITKAFPGSEVIDSRTAD